MKKIGILGGTFDPPHYGHLLIANEVLESLQLHEVWFMPNQEPPHKKKSSIGNDDRINMLELAIEGNPHFRIEPIELERIGPSYTYDTMKQLTEIYPDYTFYFIIGADMIEYLPKWHKINELLHLVEFVGVKRPAYSDATHFRIQKVDVPEIEISSSLIRKRRKEGRSIRYYLPESVRKYIEENKLYES
ncbi:nicotinic acid mononucleotide adenylyltransferase [Bacillus methanolicus PB1]|uniref:Probable nicotinate-nucleotide adenylyltransferase n=1 Tax=Bacillus methanolicus PB1 TaxID=997296 RepID=I3DXI1_BACMT|nr:nicotinate-nucleotide adenylyltransferase [Bacillus methanolicus]EIJ78952.1 nicotinic acid mononucleotide adenylyltransferase [Bacillus methanolicus PB1]